MILRQMALQQQNLECDIKRLQQWWILLPFKANISGKPFKWEPFHETTSFFNIQKKQIMEKQFSLKCQNIITQTPKVTLSAHDFDNWQFLLSF